MPRLAQVLAPSERVFFDLLEAAARNAMHAARRLEYLLEEWPAHADVARDVAACEEEGDRLAREIVDQLSQSFVTPLDRQDIHRLATALDDVVHRIEEVAGFLDLRGIEEPVAPARHQAWILQYACGAIAGATPRLRGFRDISRYPVPVAELESAPNSVVRKALASLFDGGLDPIDVVRCKDVFQRLEHAINATKRAADILEGITIKNA
jgi:uncharacterized protein Yka (UPF0111/DUF47 family)